MYDKATTEILDKVMQLANGNPGAITSLLQLFHQFETCELSEYITFHEVLDVLKDNSIKGTDLYVLFHDIANYNMDDALVILLATKLNILPSAILRDACSKQDYSGRDIINIPKLKEILKDINYKTVATHDIPIKSKHNYVLVDKSMTNFVHQSSTDLTTRTTTNPTYGLKTFPHKEYAMNYNKEYANSEFVVAKLHSITIIIEK